ncbi:MAG: efflux RND transporter permease subunit [Planctomycetaceae bacterium]|nr:efflux RND transporter permease subunit [Planctomycetaceae bacterium]
MKSIIRWAIANSPAMNSFVICGVIVGAVCLIIMRREVFPDFELDVALVTVPYPGATPAECESGICQVIEESVSGVDGIKKVTSVAKEGFGFVIMELDRGVNSESVLTDIRDEVSNVRRRFPENIEEPEIQTIKFKTTAIRLALMAPEGAEASMPPDALELQLRELADQIRDELLVQNAAPAENFLREMFKSWIVPAGKPAISTVEIMGAKPYQISVEIQEDKLRQYGLTLEQVAAIVRSENLELPAGKIRSDSQEVLIRGDNKRRLGVEIAELEVLNRDTGDPVRLGEIATIVDGFDEFSLQQYVNGRPAVVLNINRASNEDLFTVVNAVQKYVAEKQLPSGYSLHLWGDMSVDVRDRIDLLIRNGLQGLLCVFIVLALFLELKLAFWVALGIPVSMLGAGIVLLGADQTLNMLSMFSFLMALGIVVDDAIVIGENVYHKRESGMGFTQAAVEGTVEVVPSVGASIATTVIAFVPLMFVSGVMGKFIAVMPLAVIAMLVISLLESVFVLPCHLAHHRNLFLSMIGTVLYVFRPITFLIDMIRHQCDAGMKWFIEHIYAPILVRCLRYPEIALSAATALLIFMVGLVVGGHIPFTGFPNLDSQVVEATVAFPDGTSEEFARAAAEQIETGLDEAVAELEAAGSGKMLRTVFRRMGEAGNALRGPNGVSSGSHVANVLVELTPVGERRKTSEDLLNVWRKKVGAISGTESLRFGAQAMGPPGDAIEFKLLCKSNYADLLEKYADRCKAHLGTFEGVYDIDDDLKPGKEEIQFKVNELGKSLGVTENAVYSAIRSAYYGVEVMRMQRGRDEVRLMVRLPENERRTFSSFDELMVADAEGNKRPLTEIADASLSRSSAEINRVNRLRSITLSASVDASIPGVAAKVTSDLQMPEGFLDQLKSDFEAETGEQLVVNWDGAQQQNAESFTSMFSGLIIALLAMYALLTMQFQSYLQPAIIMAIIPFGYIGAVFGHGILGIELTLFSFFGLVALTGVIVNDSIVLVDFMNRFVADGGSLYDAVVEAGKRRFRAVMLTSATTIAGLMPMILETSFQAQVLIPMAASLSFGLLFGTILVLFLVPTFYLLLARLFVETDLDDLPVARGDGAAASAPEGEPIAPITPVVT